MNHFSSCGNSRTHLLSVLRGRPQAIAKIAGNESCPELSGTVRFYQIDEGVIVRVEINGLPLSEHPCQERVFGFHIHKGTDCEGNMDDPFADTITKGYPIPERGARYYLCRNGACTQPVDRISEPEALWDPN